MEKHEDKYVLRCHTLEKVNGVKEELSPVIRLKECLLRSAAADKGRKVYKPLVLPRQVFFKLSAIYTTEYLTVYTVFLRIVAAL